MIYYKSNALIINIIKKILKPVFTVLDKVLTKLNLYFFVTVLTVGAIMFLLGVFANNKNAKYFFYAGVAISLLYAFIKTKNKIFKKKGKVQAENPPQSPSTVVEQPVSSVSQTYTESTTTQTVPDYQTYIAKENTPKYYNVKGKPDYVMAEYVDRYELYLKTKTGLKKIRVDRK